MIKGRNRNIVVKSQFNINGSRGKDVGKFIADYVSRDSATDASMAYVPDPTRIPVSGDGVAFTLDSTAISRDKTLKLAEHVQDLHSQGDRAIQQMVISFDPDYLVEQGLVPPGVEIVDKGDYRGNYDDVRLRHAVRSGLQSMIDNEGFRDGNMVAAIQYDTLHLHVHAVVYENHPKLARMRGREEKGVLKQSSLNQLAYDLDRNLTLTRLPQVIPTQKMLTPKAETVASSKIVSDMPTDTPYVDVYLQLIEQEKREEALRKEDVDKEAELEAFNAMIEDAWESVEFPDDDTLSQE